MDTKETLKILNRFVELGVRRSTLEKQIGLPMNCLASVLNGKKEFPKAWEAKVDKFISENTMPPIPEPMATILVKLDEYNLLKLKEQQFGKIDEYELRIAQLENELIKLVDNNNKPENKKRILEERNGLNSNVKFINPLDKKDAYDGKKANRFLQDEYGQMRVPDFGLSSADDNLNNSEIEKQIADVKKLVKPDGMNQKVWEFDQNKRLKELKSKLK